MVFFGYMPRSGIAGSYVNSFFSYYYFFFVGCGNFHRFIEQLSKIIFKGRVLESFNESNPIACNNILSYGYIWTHWFWNYSADKKQ